MEDSEKQIQILINSRTAYVGHVIKVSNKINDVPGNCEHYKKLDCLQDQLMSLSEKITLLELIFALRNVRDFREFCSNSRN